MNFSNSLCLEYIRYTQEVLLVSRSRFQVQNLPWRAVDALHADKTNKSLQLDKRVVKAAKPIGNLNMTWNKPLKQNCRSICNSSAGRNANLCSSKQQQLHPQNTFTPLFTFGGRLFIVSEKAHLDPDCIFHFKHISNVIYTALQLCGTVLNLCHGRGSLFGRVNILGALTGDVPILHVWYI